MKNPKVFISYSHDSESHITWVRRLAEDLTRNGVSTILDVWHLRIADDLGLFMEESISGSDFTLLICTPDFSHKVNNRIGGVAFETELLVGSILTDPNSQRKFIPLLKSGLASESIPRYLRSKLFVDFSDDEFYDKSLKILLRRLFDAPEYIPPGLGDFSLSFNALPNKEENYIPKAKVLVAGLGIENKLTDKIVAASEELGKSLAVHKYGLITGGWPGVDEIVARSFSKELKKRNLPIENYLTQVIVKTDLPAYTGGKLVLINAGREEYTESVSISDAIVMIHGVGGTLETAKYGVKYNKPVFPIADSGGDAVRFYMNIISNWSKYPYKNISQLRFQCLGGMIPFVVADLMQLLDLQFSE